MSWFYSPLLPGAAQIQSAVTLTKSVTVSAVLTWGGQEADPTSDISAGSWTTNTGSSTGLSLTIDEALTNDADYIHSNTTATTAEVALTAIAAPAAGTVSIFVRVKAG